MRAPPDLPTRMRKARLQTAVGAGEHISQERMAELVSEHLAKPIRQTQWARYEVGETEPSIAIIEATAKVSGLPPEWIAFGDESRVRSVVINPTVDTRGAQVSQGGIPAPNPAAAKAAKKKRA